MIFTSNIQAFVWSTSLPQSFQISTLFLLNCIVVSMHGLYRTEVALLNSVALYTPNHQPQALNPKPSTSTSKSQTLNPTPKPQTPNPKP